MSLHFTSPTQQVLFSDGLGVMDIASESFGDEENAGQTVTIGADSIKVGHMSKVSISYDVQKVDD